MAYQHLTDSKTISSVHEAQNKLYTLARESFFRDKTNKLETEQDQSLMLQSVFKSFKDKYQSKEFFKDGNHLFESPDFQKQLVTQAKIGRLTKGPMMDKLDVVLKEDNERLNSLKSTLNHSILELTHHRGDIVKNMQKEILQVSANWGYSNQKDAAHIANSSQFESKMRTELRSMLDATLTLRASQALLGKNVHALVTNQDQAKEPSIMGNIKDLFGMVSKTANKSEPKMDESKLIREMENHKNRDFDRMFKSVSIDEIRSTALNAVKIVTERNKQMEAGISKESKGTFLDRVTQLSSKLLNSAYTNLVDIKFDEKQLEKSAVLTKAIMGSRLMAEKKQEPSMSYGL